MVIMDIKYTKNYKKSFSKLDSNIKNKAINRIELFKKDPFLKELNNHSLSWKLKDFRSINITWDFRAIFRELSNWTYEFVEFVSIWTHSQIY